MSTIRFKTKLFKIDQWTILLFPEEASAKLPSRGQTMVEGAINGFPFQTVLEPDGRWSHWFKVDKKLRDGAGVDTGDQVMVEVESIKDWPEPVVPKDLKDTLTSHPAIYDFWQSITTMARWEWIRWIRATKNPDTRRHRIEVSLSKMKAGEKRPCCFNRAMCTDPYLSKSGVLRDPSEL